MSLSKKTLGDIADAADDEVNDLLMKAIVAENSNATDMEDDLELWFPEMTPETRSMLSAERFHDWNGDVIISK